MKEAMDRLEPMDPSDSMDGIMKAVEGLISIVEKDPTSDASGEALSLIHDKENNSRNYYMRPFDSDTIYNSLIKVHLTRKEEGRADEYRRCLDLRQARKWTILGDSYALMGANSRAVKFLKRALFFGPTEDLVEEVEKAHKKALKRVEKAGKEIDTSLAKLKSDPGDLKVAVKTLSLLIDLDRIDEARKISKEVARTWPDDFDIMYRSGSVEFGMGDFVKAKKIFTKALKMNPNSTNAKRAFNLTEEMLSGNL